MKDINGRLRRNIAYLLISNSQIYLFKLIKNTLSIGAVTFVLCWMYLNTGLHEVKIPASLHSLIGLVIGLLLVFRTNTAYDRWWEGRKRISSISTSVGMLAVSLKRTMPATAYDEVRSMLCDFMDNLVEYLSTAEHVRLNTTDFHKKQIQTVQDIADKIDEHHDKKPSAVDDCLKSIMQDSNYCEMIKNTPIPLGFMLHIKTSILIYILTLPFGLFADLGLWPATIMVMVIFYVIAGIEIISNEIENPFAGDPNDLPIKELFDGIKMSIE